VEEVCYPALPCKLAVHDPQNALVEEEGVLSLRCHASKLLSHRMLWWKGVLSLRYVKLLL
jgi:hypothetical protein